MPWCRPSLGTMENAPDYSRLKAVNALGQFPFDETHAGEDRSPRLLGGVIADALVDVKVVLPDDLLILAIRDVPLEPVEGREVSRRIAMMRTASGLPVPAARAARKPTSFCSHASSVTSRCHMRRAFIAARCCLKQTKTIATAPDADGIIYEPTTKHIYVVNSDSGSISVIDPSTDRNIATINVGSKLEPAVADGNGHIYVNGEEKNEIVAVDANTNQVIAHWALPTCQRPHGIAIDRSTRRHFQFVPTRFSSL